MKFSSTIDLNCKIHYVDIGDTSSKGAAILFLHGWGLEGKTFLPSLRILAKDRRVIAPDLPGFGRTKCVIADWTYDRLAEIMTSFIFDLGVQRVHLIGHSLGAAICLKMAAILPKNVLSLMLIDSAGVPIGSPRNFILRRLFGLSEQLVVQFVLSPRYSTLYLIAIAYNFLVNFRSNHNVINMPLYGDLQLTANQVKHQTLIAWGEKDRTTPVEMGIALSNHIQNSRLLVLPGNYYHEWSILYPHKFAEIASKFIDTVEH